MANTTTRGRSRKADKPEQPKAADPEAAEQPKPQQQAEPKPAKAEEPKPYGRVTVESVPVIYHKPSIAIVTPNPDGSESIEHVDTCPHRYLHESPKAAIACGKRIVGQRGLTDVRVV